MEVTHPVFTNDTTPTPVHSHLNLPTLNLRSPAISPSPMLKVISAGLFWLFPSIRRCFFYITHLKCSTCCPEDPSQISGTLKF